MAAADLASAPDDSKKTSLTDTSVGETRPQEKMEAAKTETQEESKDVSASEKDAVTEKRAEAGQPNIDDEDVEYPHGVKLWVTLAALCLAVFLVALDQTIISTAIPKITDHFNSIQDIGWYGSSYLLTATALQPTFGKVYTIFSVSISFHPRGSHFTDIFCQIKVTFLSAIAVFELGSVFTPMYWNLLTSCQLFGLCHGAV